MKFAIKKENEFHGGKVGKKVKIGPIEAEVLPDEECAKADFFVCATKEQCEKVVKIMGYDPYPKGSKAGYFCQYCNVELQIAPSGQQLVAMGAKPCCLDCAKKATDNPS